jgi:hypothetical protein
VVVHNIAGSRAPDSEWPDITLRVGPGYLLGRKQLTAKIILGSGTTPMLGLARNGLSRFPPFRGRVEDVDTLKRYWLLRGLFCRQLYRRRWHNRDNRIMNLPHAQIGYR